MTKLSKNNSDIENSGLDNTLESNNNAEAAVSQNQEQKKLNEIRNLLFGQNVEEYRSEFEELKAIIQENKSESEQSLSGFQTDIFDRLEKLESKLNDVLQTSSETLSERLDQLSKDKVDRKTMASILHKLASQLEE